jgi:hypothetical protein
MKLWKLEELLPMLKKYFIGCTGIKKIYRRVALWHRKGKQFFENEVDL